MAGGGAGLRRHDVPAVWVCLAWPWFIFVHGLHDARGATLCERSEWSGE